MLRPQLLTSICNDVHAVGVQLAPASLIPVPGVTAAEVPVHTEHSRLPQAINNKSHKI